MQNCWPLHENLQTPVLLQTHFIFIFIAVGARTMVPFCIYWNDIIVGF
jgi:hypothetical protein